ncbi:DUF5693 family protein [Natronospora cellulosivora (SeqCode)]
MSKKIILIVFLFAIIASLVSINGRHQLENSVNNIELIMDYQSIEMLDIEDKKEYMSTLEESGLTAIAIYPEDLGSLINDGKAYFIHAREVDRMLMTTAMINPALSSYQYQQDSAFIIVEDILYIRRLQEFLPQWSEEYDIDYHIEGRELIIFFENWDSKYQYLSIGFDNDEVNNINAVNLKVIPRFNNHELVKQQNWELMAEMAPPFIIFSGQEITGFDRSNTTGLDKTASIMQDTNTTFGMIEPFLARQEGATTLARNLDYNLLRVHSIQQVEMDQRQNYTVDNIIDRYMRAVRERNVRLLYLRPFLEARNEMSPEDMTLSYIKELSHRLQEAGYTTNSVQSYSNYRNSNILLLISSLGVIIAGLIFLEYLLGIKFKKYFWLLLLFGLIAGFLLLITGRTIMLRKIAALASAIVFPSLAVISQLYKNDERWILRFLKATTISMLGVLFLSSAMSDIAFILNVEQFTGVKISFIMPLFLISIYYMRKFNEYSKTTWQKRIHELWETSIKIKHIVLLAVFALAGLIYITRTGNNPMIPVFEFEITIRNFLENILLIRPRFKELIGHPAFLIALAFSTKISSKLYYYYPLILLAAIAQINILNTFSHIHTPFMISLIRTFHGIWIGLFLGYLAVIFIKYIIANSGKILSKFNLDSKG